jgi:hypothetical protein
MACAEKVRLVEEYIAAASALSAVVHGVRLKTGVKFREALAASKAEHTECARARCALLDHKLLHKC